MPIHVDVRIAVQPGHGPRDLLLHRGEVLPGDLEVRLGAFIGGAGGEVRCEQSFLAREFAPVEIGRIAGGEGVGQLLAIGRLQRLDLHARTGQPRLGLGHGEPVGLRIDAEQQLAFADPLVVLYPDLHDLAGHPGIDRVPRRADERIVRRDVAHVGEEPGGTAQRQHHRQGKHQWPAQPFPRRAGRGRRPVPCVRGLRVVVDFLKHDLDPVSRVSDAVAGAVVGRHRHRGCPACAVAP